MGFTCILYTNIILDGRYWDFKSSMGYFPLMLCVISLLKCILLLHQNFGKLNLWMQISFIILFMIDLYKDNHVCAFVNFFFKKNFYSETIDWTFTKSHKSVP